MNDKEQAYFLFRLFVGFNFFFHGFVDFYSKMPTVAWADGIHLIEITIGVLLILGLMTRVALWVGNIFLVLLLTGTALLGEWSSVADQLLYSLSLFLLLYNLSENKFSLDVLIKKTRKIGF